MDCDHVRNTASTHQDYRCEEATVEAAHTAILVQCARRGGDRGTVTILHENSTIHAFIEA